MKYDFPTIPIVLVTATATPSIEERLRALLRNPFISNIELQVEEWFKSAADPFQPFTKRVSVIIGDDPCIIYTDFNHDVGPMLSAIRDLEISAVGYYGEMENKSKSESHQKWKNGEAQVIVATKLLVWGLIELMFAISLEMVSQKV